MNVDDSLAKKWKGQRKEKWREKCRERKERGESSDSKGKWRVGGRRAKGKNEGERKIRVEW